MRKLTLFSTVLATMFVTGVAHPDPQDDLEHDPRIREELRGAEVGRHTAFAMLAGTYRAGQQEHPDIFWQVVRTDMQLDSEKSAKAFLARLVAAADELDKAHNKAYLEFLCGPDSPRERATVTAALDTWDDLTDITDHNAYTEFVSRMDENQAQQFDAFLDEYKEGAQQIKFYHDQVYTPEMDVVGRVDATCAGLRRMAPTAIRR